MGKTRLEQNATFSSAKKEREGAINFHLGSNVFATNGVEQIGNCEKFISSTFLVVQKLGENNFLHQ